MQRLWLVLAIAACGGAPRSAPAPAGEPVALAVVMSGWEVWIGNDHNPKVAADAAERTPGALDRVVAAFAKADLARTAPTGSQATLVTYADRATIRVPLGPIANLTTAGFGTQLDYYSTFGTELVSAIALAADELDKAPPGHRYLIVLGDGNDTNNEVARQQLPKLAERLARSHVAVTAIVYRTGVSVEGDIIGALTPNVTRPTTLDGFEGELARTLGTVR